MSCNYIYDLLEGGGELHEQQECTNIHEGRGGNWGIN
jgi:hypothetical protein